jgi:hypothetical protein
VTLDELVREACDTGDVDAALSKENEALGRLGAALTEASSGGGAGAHALRTVTERRRVDGEVLLEPAPADAVDGLPEISVMASGCLGLISFPRLPGRVTREQIEARYPRLLPALAEHPGIGFAAVRAESGGAVVIGARGERWLADGRLEGEDPLAPFGPNAARHVARTDRFGHCPDVLVNSTYWPETDDVAAFEELVGSHGGMGGPQSFPFVLAPAGLPLPDEPMVGAEAVHRVFRGWLAGLGHSAYEPR